jgi:hypothetical protein
MAHHVHFSPDRPHWGSPSDSTLRQLNENNCSNTSLFFFNHNFLLKQRTLVIFYQMQRRKVFFSYDETSVVDLKLFFSDSDPDPIFVRVLDPDPDPDPF